VGADQRRAVRSRHLRELRVEAAPRVVEQVGAGLAHGTADLGAPGVDADHQVGELRAHPGHERDRAADLLCGVDLLPWSRLHTADVDEVRALADHEPDPVERLVLGVGRAGVVEGVGGLVDDRHDQQTGVGEAATTEREHVGRLRRAHLMTRIGGDIRG